MKASVRAKLRKFEDSWNRTRRENGKKHKNAIELQRRKVEPLSPAKQRLVDQKAEEWEQRAKWRKMDRELDGIDRAIDVALAKAIAAGWNPETRTWTRDE